MKKKKDAATKTINGHPAGSRMRKPLWDGYLELVSMVTFLETIDWVHGNGLNLTSLKFMYT